MKFHTLVRLNRLQTIDADNDPRGFFVMKTFPRKGATTQPAWTAG